MLLVVRVGHPAFRAFQQIVPVIVDKYGPMMGLPVFSTIETAKILLKSWYNSRTDRNTLYVRHLLATGQLRISALGDLQGFPTCCNVCKATCPAPQMVVLQESSGVARLHPNRHET